MESTVGEELRVKNVTMNQKMDMGRKLLVLKLRKLTDFKDNDFFCYTGIAHLVSPMLTSIFHNFYHTNVQSTQRLLNIF